MRHMVTFVLMLCLGCQGVSAQVNGVLDTVEGKRVLWVWGTHEERGFAHGFLLAPEVKGMFEDYILAHVCNGQPALYQTIRSFYLAHYAVDPPYALEAQGIVEGMGAAGVSPWCSILGRTIDATDLLVANAIADLSQSVGGIATSMVGCSSLSSWGTSTAEDSMLGGGLVITRLMDWENHPTLAQNHLLIVSLPEEEDEHPWVSLTFPAFIGGLSAIASSGLGAFLNVGNRPEYVLGEPFQPILFSVRTGIERRDVDGDGSHTWADLLAAIEARNRSSASIVHVVTDEGQSSHPVIIECNNQRGVVTRDVAFEDAIPGEHLLATNHFRLLYPPVYCPRYAAVAESLRASASMTVGRSWSVMTHACALPNNLHVMEYLPARSLLRWATSTVGHPAYQFEPVTLDLAQIFEPPARATTRPRQLLRLLAWPNPSSKEASIHFELTSPGPCTLEAYALDGSLVARLLCGWLGAGPHEAVWRNIPGSGAYVLSLHTPSGRGTGRLVRMR